MRRVAGSACGNILSCIVRTRETSQFSRLPLNEDARANTAKKEMREHQRNNSRQMGGWFARRNVQPAISVTRETSQPEIGPYSEP